MANTQKSENFSAQPVAGPVDNRGRMARMSAKRAGGAGPQKKSVGMDVMNTNSGGKGPGVGGKMTKATLHKSRQQNGRRNQLRARPIRRASRQHKGLKHRTSAHPRWWLKPLVNVLLAAISVIGRWPWGK